jgi:hypothetical protein
MSDLIPGVESQFLKNIQPGDDVLFYFSGYSAEVIDDDTYLLPADFDPDGSADLQDRAWRLTRVMQKVDQKKAGLRIYVIDAGRVINRAVRGASGAGMISPDLSDSASTLVCFPAFPNRTVSNPGGALTEALIREISRPESALTGVFARIKEDVAAATNNQQIPYEVDNIVGSDFYFRPPEAAAEVRHPAPPGTPPPPDTHGLELHRFYRYEPAAGSFTPLEAQQSAMRTHVKALGYAGATTGVKLNGMASPVRVKAGQEQAFAVRTVEGELITGELFQSLYNAQSKSGARIVTLGVAGSFGVHARTLTGVPIDVARIDRTTLRITPRKPLAPGEYVFLAPSQWQAGSAVAAFCFGVDP